MSETEGLALADIGELGKVADASNQVEILLLASAPEGVLQLKGHVEVVLDGGLAASCHEHEALDAGSDGLFNHVLDDGSVHEGKHLLRLSLGGRQETSTQARDGNDGFAKRLHDLSHGP